MKNKLLKKILCTALFTTSLLSVSSVGANAEWRKSGTNRWGFLDKSKVTSCVWLHDKDTGKTYFTNMLMDMVTGWVIIDNKWYYFYQDGSLAKNTIIDGKYQVGSDGSWNNGKLNESGIISLFSYDISNGNIIGTHNENNTSSIADKKFSKESIKTVEDLETYLKENYSSLKTPIGTLDFTFDIHDNDSKIIAYDFWIETNWGKIKNSKYNIDYFSPYDLKYSSEFSDSDKEETKELLKDYQQKIAKTAIKYFPKKKIEGGFFSSGKSYSIDFLSWKNYGDGLDYDETEVTDFNWDDKYDDYYFSNSEDVDDQEYDNYSTNNTSSTSDDSYYDDSSKGSNETWVSGYYRNGKYVSGHYRTKKDSTTSNNYSHKGNINPHNGKRGYSKK